MSSPIDHHAPEQAHDVAHGQQADHALYTAWRSLGLLIGEELNRRTQHQENDNNVR